MQNLTITGFEVANLHYKSFIILLSKTFYVFCKLANILWSQQKLQEISLKRNIQLYPANL